LEIKPGTITLIAGPTGAGKTTLCSCLNGLVPHFFGGDFQGGVTVDGINTRKATVSQLSRIAGLLFQDPASQLVTSTVEDEVAFGPENLGVPANEISKRIDETLTYTRLSKFRHSAPYALSGGQQQSCALASIFSLSPILYVLDEPTSNLDPIGTDIIFGLLNDLRKLHGKTIVLVEHKIDNLVELVDTVVIMNNGEIALAGSPREILGVEASYLEKIGLRPPVSPLLARKLTDIGIRLDGVPLTFEEALHTFSKATNSSESPPRPESEVQRKDTKKEVIIECRNISFTYPSGTTAINGVNLEIRKGEFLGLIGQNGSGKTTLSKHYNGLLRPTTGNVLVYGMNTKTAPTKELIRKVAYVFQNPDRQLFCPSVRDEIKYTLRNIGVSQEMIGERVEQIAEELKIGHLLEQKPFEISRGDRQRVAIASVLALDPEVLIVDEPTTGQDPKGRRSIMDLLTRLNDEGKTIVIITHDMDLAAEYARRIVVMNNGEILLDAGPREVFRQTDVLRKAYLKPPRVTQLFQYLRKNGMPVRDDVLTQTEAIDVLVENFGNNLPS
jgi:energy-coupling factor transport system ATP-binding protein